MAFGNLKFDTLTTSDAKNTNTEKSLDTSYVFNGVCKVWWTLNGEGTIASRDSFNVSSFDDNGTGNYDANFTNNMSNANYSFNGTTGVEANTAYVINYHDGQAPSTSAIRFACEINNNATFQDMGFIHGQIQGDLA